MAFIRPIINFIRRCFRYFKRKTMFKAVNTPVANSTVLLEAVLIGANAHSSLSLDDDDQEQEVLIEPRFKYHRVVDASRVLPDRNTISYFIVHDKFITVGCASGRSRIFDILGNLRKEYTQKKHKCSVTKIAVDKSGSYLTSRANDSTVAITGVGCDEYDYVLTVPQSARSVEIAENFIKKNGQMKKIKIIHRIRLKNFHISGLSFTLNSIQKDGEKSWKEVAIFGIKVVQQKAKSFPDDTSTVSQISGKSSKPQSVMAVPIKNGQQTLLFIYFQLPKTSDDVIFAIQYYVQLFEKYGQVLKLVPYLPQTQQKLEPKCYESVIQQALGRLKSQLSREDRIFTIQALARLFAFERQYDKALALFLQLKDTGIFSFIRQYHLFSSVKNQVVELMEINADLAIRSSLGQTKIADFKTIVPMPRIQMKYLNQLISRGEGYEYADLLVKLFAEWLPERLLPFLRKCKDYDMDKAIDICKKNKLQDELLFLLKRKKNLAFSIFFVLDGTLMFCRQYV